MSLPAWGRTSQNAGLRIGLALKKFRGLQVRRLASFSSNLDMHSGKETLPSFEVAVDVQLLFSPIQFDIADELYGFQP